MFTITPIGSCRITTPLRRGQDVHGFNLNMDRCYGYCHSPAEAVQMVRFMQGSADIPHDVWPLVSRKHELATIAANDHTPSDLYVVELASAKQVTIDGVSIQLNYLSATFPEFFADMVRAQTFWALAETGDSAGMTAFLDQHWSATPEQQADAQTLGKLQLRFVTREGLRQDIKTLTEMLPDVLFVSHVDACKQDGLPIRSRSNFIQMVAEEAELAGCNFYNPTTLMDEFGQAAAIEDESAGLAHFTDAFANGIMDDWMRSIIAPKTDGAVQQSASGVLERHLQPQISAACNSGQFVRTGARLQSLSQGGVEVQTLLDKMMKAQAHAKANFLNEIQDNEDLSAHDRTQLVVKASRLGLFDEALRLAESAPAGLADIPVHVVMQLGDLANQAGDTDTTIKAFRAAASRGQARACAALTALSIAQEYDVLGDFTPDQRAAFLAQASPANRLQILQLNGASFTESVTKATGPNEAEETVSRLADTHGIGYAAEVLASWREHQGTDRVTDKALVSILESWVSAALSFGERINRIHGLNAVLFAAPRHRSARVAMQDLRKELALLIRAAGKEGDIDALDALSADAAALTTELPELDLWRARLRFGLGEYATALELGQSAAAFLPEKINVWVLLMRAATKADYPTEAVEFAMKVIGLTCPKTQALKSEAEAVLHSHAVGV